MKSCTVCQVTRPVEDFYRDASCKDGRRSKCRDCSKRQAAEWTAANPHRRSTINRRHVLKKKYGLTPEQYDAMLAEQHGRCAACGTTDPGCKGAFQVDHDHACCPGAFTCGRCVRGLLCFSCNVVLGSVEDSPDRLHRLADYLTRGHVAHSDWRTH